jgi:hypothetical protein
VKATDSKLLELLSYDNSLVTRSVSADCADLFEAECSRQPEKRRMVTSVFYCCRFVLEAGAGKTVDPSLPFNVGIVVRPTKIRNIKIPTRLDPDGFTAVYESREATK